MTLKQAEELVVSLLKPLFAYAIKRCAAPEDAEDLTQEIVLRLLRMLPKRDDLQDAESYCWTVAHNMLSNYYRKKAKSAYGAISDDIADDFDFYGNYEQQETEKRLQLEIAYLSKTRRQIVILFYYENIKQQEIADRLGISLSMVKGHLSEAKNDLKRSIDTMRANSELKFNPIRFDMIGCNGSPGTLGHNGNFLRSSLSQNIIYVVRREALSVNEIADALGVSPVYVESDVEFLAENGFLVKSGKGYISNCVIDEPSQALTQLHDDIYSRAAELIAPELFDTLNENVRLGEDGIICPRGDMNFALWSLIPYVAAMCDDKSIPETISFEEAATMRPDGGHNICVCAVTNPDVTPPLYWNSMQNMSGPCRNGRDDFRLWLIDTEWSTQRVGNPDSTVGRDCDLLKYFFQDDTLSKDELVHLISRGYLKHEQHGGGERTSLQIVWIQDKQAKGRLMSLGEAVKEKHRAELESLKTPFVKAVLDVTPTHLKKAQGYCLQFIFHSDGWFILHCLKNLVNSGKLKLPTEEQRKSLTAVAVTAE